MKEKLQLTENILKKIVCLGGRLSNTLQQYFFLHYNLAFVCRQKSVVRIGIQNRKEFLKKNRNKNGQS